MQVKHVNRPKIWQCVNCGKKPQASLNRPHSQHKTKRTVKPNLQKFKGNLFCIKCLRTIKPRLQQKGVIQK